MSPRQCEIAAEAYTASLLAQCGYDVLVQYGANQPDYDLIAKQDQRTLPISVKGSQMGGWMLAVRYKKPGVTYLAAIDQWLAAQKPDVVFVFVVFWLVPFGTAPRVYAARPHDIAKQLKSQHKGTGHGSLHEDTPRDSPKSKYMDKLPSSWLFTKVRIDSL